MKRTQEHNKKIYKSTWGNSKVKKLMIEGMRRAWKNSKRDRTLLYKCTWGNKKVRNVMILKNKKTNNTLEVKIKQRNLKLGELNSMKKEKVRRIHLKSVCHFRIKYSGENNPNWQGGLSFIPYPLEWTTNLKEYILERDKQMCILCSENSKQLHIHHIDYNKDNCEENNLITLCISCHAKTGVNRKYWEDYFTTIIKEKYNTPTTPT